MRMTSFEEVELSKCSKALAGRFNRLGLPPEWFYNAAFSGVLKARKHATHQSKKFLWLNMQAEAYYLLGKELDRGRSHKSKSVRSFTFTDMTAGAGTAGTEDDDESCQWEAESREPDFTLIPDRTQFWEKVENALTKQEYRMVRAWANGHVDREIAEEHGMSRSYARLIRELAIEKLKALDWSEERAVGV